MTAVAKGMAFTVILYMEYRDDLTMTGKTFFKRKHTHKKKFKYILYYHAHNYRIFETFFLGIPGQGTVSTHLSLHPGRSSV